MTSKDLTPMKPCPDSPNCVSSDARDSRHAIEPLRLTMAPKDAWPMVRETVESLPRVRIVESNGRWLHAEARTRILRFTDDLELELRADEGIIAVRSASRVGSSDLGVNRRRIEELRRLLRVRGVVE